MVISVMLLVTQYDGMSDNVDWKQIPQNIVFQLQSMLANSFPQVTLKYSGKYY